MHFILIGNAETVAQAEPIVIYRGCNGASYRLHWSRHGNETGGDSLFGVQVVALAEIIEMLNKNGVTSTKAMTYLGQLPVISPTAKGAGNLMVLNNHTPLFPIKLVEKDLRYVTQTTRVANAPSPVSIAVHKIHEKATGGYADNNITGIIKIFAS